MMREHQVRLELRSQLLHKLLDLIPAEREVTVAESFDDDLLRVGILQENPGTVFGFPGSRWRGAKDHPVNRDIRVLLDHFKQGAATADFNIVGVSAQTQNRKW